MDKKLDLSRLTEEEAKHVWEVIQRDFVLRKKEEERLGELKSKIDKEETKRELLGSQSNLTDSHCIRCLQPFKFLVNSKRQCLDCKLYTCKTCSRYNKKERGWVCDPCRMSRVLKIGTLGWYHDNVRSRFKRFGSAKVMRSLYKRLNEEDVYNGHEDEHLDASEAQRYKQMRKTNTHSRRQSFQYIHEERGQRNDVEYNSDMYHHHHHRMNRRKSLDRFSRPDDGTYSEHRMVRARSLSKINSSVAPRQIYLDTSEEEDTFRYPVYQLPPRRRSRASSQENVHQSAPPINELNKRMSAIESLLNRLEEKMTLPPDQPVQPTAGQMEEEKLRRKLDELMSDKALSSDEDEPKRPPQSKGSAVRGDQAPVAQEPLSSSSDEMPTEAHKVYMTAGKSFSMAKKLQMIEQNTKNHYGGPFTDSELSDLEDQVTLAAAKVQSTESEVSDIESKMAVLSAKGLSFDKAKKKVTGTKINISQNNEIVYRKSVSNKNSC
uniref:Melanophilin a n=1 Tax=Cyprinus carpio TaxID=7962 RepID=A0A8C1R9K9_CYPCA